MIDTISRAIPEGEPLLVPVVESGIDGTAYVMSGQDWAKSADSIATVNELTMSLQNIGSLSIDSIQANINTKETTIVKVTTDQTVTVAMTGYDHVTNVLANGVILPFTFNKNNNTDRILSFTLPKGNHSIVIMAK